MFKQYIALFIEDFVANRFNTKGLFIIFFFRLGSFVKSSNIIVRVVFFFIPLLYALFVKYLLCVDLPLCVKIGGGCRIYHGFGLVVHQNVIIGSNCLLRHGVTLGERNVGSSLVPVIGDSVEFGCNSIALGPIVVGNRALVGAGAVVLKSIPDGGVVVGASSILIRVNSRSVDI